ncbi:MAG: hypothetical protein IJS68_02330 [Clostridia bacterium]|nr:hypothetical protein [Clostridia bacterium]
MAVYKANNGGKRWSDNSKGAKIGITLGVAAGILFGGVVGANVATSSIMNGKADEAARLAREDERSKYVDYISKEDLNANYVVKSMYDELQTKYQNLNDSILPILFSTIKNVVPNMDELEEGTNDQVEWLQNVETVVKAYVITAAANEEALKDALAENEGLTTSLDALINNLSAVSAQDGLKAALEMSKEAFTGLKNDIASIAKSDDTKIAQAKQWGALVDGYRNELTNLANEVDRLVQFENYYNEIADKMDQYGVQTPAELVAVLEEKIATAGAERDQAQQDLAAAQEAIEGLNEDLVHYKEENDQLKLQLQALQNTSSQTQISTEQSGNGATGVSDNQEEDTSYQGEDMGHTPGLSESTHTHDDDAAPRR